MKTFVITEQDTGIRLDLFLIKQLEEVSRNHIQIKIKEGHILVNNQKVKAGYILKLEDKITIEVVEPKELDIQAVDMNLNIVYEDEDIIVVNKPKGMVVHPANTYQEPTLVHGLLYQATQLSGINGVTRPGIVHRIDKDTSGLLLVAKNDFSHQELAKDFAKHEVKRSYVALVYGTFTIETATIDAPIKRHPVDRMKMAVSKDGKRAVTHIRVLTQYEKYALINCELETGRTHQIRVHLAYIKHPIVGDPLYGPRKIIGHSGQFLHAHTLTFMHPTKKKQMTFTAEMPLEFKTFLETLD